MPDERAVRLEWSGAGLKFSGGGTAPATLPVTVDGDSVAGPSPMLLLLLAAAGCSGADVVSILGKMRVALREFSVDVRGVRKEEHPRRYTGLHLHYRMVGEGLDRAKAERAVSLSLDRYCSVVHSLASDITVSHDIELA